MVVLPLCSTLNSWIGEFVVSFFDVTNRLFIYFLFTDSAEMVGILQNHAKQMRSVHIHMGASLTNFSTKSKILNYFSWTKIALFLNLLLLIWSFSQTLQISGRYFRILLWRTTLLIWWRLFRWTMHSQVIFLTASFNLAVLKLGW